jgi:replication factor A1
MVILFMMINELKRGMSGISVEGKIVNISDTRRVNTRYGPRSVADARFEDETGFIKLSLWEEKIESVHIGDRIKIDEAYVTEFRNELQLNIPRSGKLEIIERRKNTSQNFLIE